MTKVFCPKCREQLQTGDLVIDKKWTKDIKTMGVVQISAGGSVVNATIVATDIIVGGDVTKAILKPSRAVELETGAVLNPSAIEKCNIVVRKGARVAFDPVVTCANLDVKGEINARACPNGMATIHPGGFFRGELAGSHLVVMDGGGLKAKLSIDPIQKAGQVS